MIERRVIAFKADYDLINQHDAKRTQRPIANSTHNNGYLLPNKTPQRTAIRRKDNDNRMNPRKTNLFRTKFLGKSHNRNNKTKAKPAKTRGNSSNPPIPKHEAAIMTHKRVNITFFILGLNDFIMITQ